MASSRYRYTPGSPPVPTVLVNLSFAGTGSTVPNVAAIADTGADQTVVPVARVTALGAPKLDQELVRGFDGTPQLLATYLIHVQIRDLPPAEVEVIASDRVADVIVGRDLLNRYYIQLDGPNTALVISDEPFTR